VKSYFFVGGSWHITTPLLGASNPNWNVLYVRRRYLGFRLVRSKA